MLAVSEVLVVSSYPPRHCGIGAYARTQVDVLRRDGLRVTVVSPPDGDGDVRVPFHGGRPFLAAARLGRHADRIVVHFQPALYYRPRAPLSKIGTSLGLLWLVLRRPQTEVLVHEADEPKRWRPDYLLLAAAFRAAPALLFHTASERDRLRRAYGILTRSRLVPHVEGVTVHGPVSRTEARERLHVPAGEPALVCPGFLHPDKGIERALAAFRAAGAGRLYVVGSVKDRTPRNEAYAARLREQVSATPGAEMVERYLDDVEFDLWIIAADAVVLPYRRSWSSGALARAQALGTPVIVTAVGGLAEQASARDMVVHDDDGLRAAVAAIVSPRASEVPG
jgi:glycosyltransferase involved in cell wall biosynthesis